MPKISICIPTYNAERYLAETLDSALSQSFADYEIIISDNASTDGTWELIQAYARKSHKIRYFRNESNLGAVPNFNCAFRRCCGERINFLSADDLLSSDSLATNNRLMDQYPEVGMVIGSYNEIDEHSSIRPDSTILLNDRLYRAREYLLEKPGVGLQFLLPGVLFTRQALLKMGGMDEHYSLAADFDLLLRIALEFSFYTHSHLVTSYRVHQGNATNQLPAASRIQQVLDLWSRMIDRLELPTQSLAECEARAARNLCNYAVVRCLIAGRYEEAMVASRLVQNWRQNSVTLEQLCAHSIYLTKDHEGRYQELVALLRKENETLRRANQKLTSLRGGPTA